MIRSLQVRWVLIATFAAGAVIARSEDPAPSSVSASSPIVTTSGTDQPTSPSVPAAARHHRVISSEIAAQLSAATPKYTPPKPKPPTDDDQADLRETDKPRNGIIRLPKYVVTEKPPPVLTERAIYTKAGLADLAKSRYLTEGYLALNRWQLPLFGTSSEAHAMALYEEDERLRNMSALSEDARMVSSSDKAAGLYVKRQVDSTFMHAPDFDWKPIGR